MKTLTFSCLDSFPDKHSNSQINTCTANLLKQALDRKHSGDTHITSFYL